MREIKGKLFFFKYVEEKLARLITFLCVCVYIFKQRRNWGKENDLVARFIPCDCVDFLISGPEEDGLFFISLLFCRKEKIKFF